MKVAINTCYGGFSISDKAIERYAEIKGLTLYPEKSHWHTTWWTIPEELRTTSGFIPANEFHEASIEARVKSNNLYEKHTINLMDIDRNDPVLIQVIEELGPEANGDYADLSIIEIPDDVDWYIGEYDGKEHVAEKHRTWY